MDLLNSESDPGESDDGAIAGCSKYFKKAFYSNSDLEDVSVFGHSSILDEAFEPPQLKETSSKVKNKKTKKEKNQKNISTLMAIIDFFNFFFSFKKLCSNIFKN